MNESTDQQLLRDYVDRKSDAAFAAIVQRYVDLVYSAALRLGGDAHAARDVTQCVFVALSQNARQLADRPILAGWLHTTARNIAAKAIRSEARRRAREQEAVVMNELLAGDPDASWEQIAPHLDEALSDLDAIDRDAVLLRYFQNQSLRIVGQQLGVSDDTAQKRVSRAVDRLREIFAKRGLTIGASGLAVLISANSVQAAPIGFAATITAATTLAGAGIAASTTATATKVIAMTTVQKTLIGAAIAAAVGTGIYEKRQAATYQTQAQTLREQQAPLNEQIKQLQQERDDAASKVAALNEELERLNRNPTELLKLRAELSRLQNSQKTPATGQTSASSTSRRAEATNSVPELIEEGSLLWRTGQLSEALPKFEAAVRLDPGNSTAWNGLGWVSFNSGKPAEAEQAFQKVVELEPDHPAALNGLGQIYLSQKKYAEAETYLLKASPKAPAAWYGLAKLYLLQDKFDQAEHWAQTIIDSGQGDEGTRAMLKAAKEKNVSPALRLMIEPQ